MTSRNTQRGVADDLIAKLETFSMTSIPKPPANGHPLKWAVSPARFLNNFADRDQRVGDLLTPRGTRAKSHKLPLIQVDAITGIHDR